MTNALVLLGMIAALASTVVLLDWLAARRAQRSNRRGA